jgi:hypothetical protein
MSLQYLHCPSFLVNNRLKKRPKKRLNGNFDSLPSQSGTEYTPLPRNVGGTKAWYAVLCI